MKIIQQNELSSKQKIEILNLWNNEYPEKLTYERILDFEKYLNKLINQNHYLLLNENKEITGWATTFTRENEVWFAIIISENIQGKGFGTKLLERLKTEEDILNGWVIDHNLDKKLNGKLYQSPLEFYTKNKFKILNDIRLETELISAIKIKWMKK